MYYFAIKWLPSEGMFSETTGPTEAKFHVALPWVGEKMESLFNYLGHLLLFIIFNLRGAGPFSRGLPQIWPHGAGLIAGL